MNKKFVFVLLLCLVAALSITAASAPVESTIISPSVSAQPMNTNVPDSPDASYEDYSRAASFRATLEANGFIVNSGQMTPIDPIVDLLDSGIGDSANGNNAGQPYKVLMVPISPSGEEIPLERGLTIFRLRPDEAVVYLGPTPPPCDYFSFTVFLWVRHKDSLVPKGDWMVAAVNDPLNNALIKTEGNGTPFRKQTIVIFTADGGVYERVAAMAQEAGYPKSMINPYVIPSGLLNLGVFPETPLADSFIILVRTANFASKLEGDLYLSNDHYARVWRVTPETAPALDPFPTPEQRVRKWKSESELYPDLENGLERLENAIIAQTPHDGYESYESIRWFADSREVLEETDPASPLYHKFVAGEASDTPYLRTSLSGEAANFTLGSDDMVVVYGVNHAATGLATYSNFGVYGDWVTSSCQDDPWQYVFGCGDRSWNGVVSMTNHVFSGSAEKYIPGDPMAPYLYAVKVLRQPPQDKTDKYYVVVPTATPEHPCESPGYCLGLDDPIIIGYRAYLNPATASGADYDDIIHDRAIWFRLRESPGSGSTSDSGTLYVASIPSGATILINGTDFGTTNKFVTEVPAGNQNLTLTKAGYQPYSTVVTVPPNGGKVLASITLTKSGEGEVPPEDTGTLYVASIPSGATILINGTDFGTTNKFVTGIPAGNQNLTLLRNGYQPYTTLVTITSGGSKVLAPVTLIKGTPAGPEVTSPVLVVTIPAGDEHGPCRIMINRERHTFTFTGVGFNPEKRYYLQYTLPGTDGIHTIAMVNATPSGTVQHEGIWTREGSSTPVFQLNTTAPPIALMLFGNYEPVRGWNDYLDYYDWYWTLSTSATWTPPPAGVMIDHYQVTIYGIIYDDRIGTRETKWLGSAEIPPQGIALTPPLSDTFSYIDTLCYSPDFCDDPLIQPPFTASGTIWDSAGNSYSASMMLFPAD